MDITEAVQQLLRGTLGWDTVDDATRKGKRDDIDIYGDNDAIQQQLHSQKHHVALHISDRARSSIAGKLISCKYYLLRHRSEHPK